LASLIRCQRRADFIRTSIPEKYDFSPKFTTHVKLLVTSNRNCVVIVVANQIGDPRNRISHKYSPRSDDLIISRFQRVAHETDDFPADKPTPDARREGPIGTFINLRTTTSQNSEAVPRRALIQGS